MIKNINGQYTNNYNMLNSIANTAHLKQEWSNLETKKELPELDSKNFEIN